MTASDKLQELTENNKLTDEQLDNLSDWGVQKVSDLQDYLIDQLKELPNNKSSIDYEEAVSTLYDLLNYSDDDDFVIYEGNGITELDFDILNDVLDVD